MPFGSAKFYGFLVIITKIIITTARTIKLTTTTITTSNKNLREDHDNVVGLSGLKQGAVHDETVSKKIPKHQ